MLVPNRHESSESYRYGFQNQEKDDEVKGEGNSINYTFRMHDPRTGRFFATDPLKSKFAWFSPYQFGGNRPIDAIEFEGAESGVVLGSARQVVLANQFNTNVPIEKQNWVAYQLISMQKALADVQNHKKLGNKVEVLLLQAHASSGSMRIFEGPDGIVETQAVKIGETYFTDDYPLNDTQVNFYIEDLQRINSIKSKGKRKEEMAIFKSYDKIQQIDSFLALVNEIEDGGTLILNGCHIFSNETGKVLSEGIQKLTNKRINILGPQDYVSDMYYTSDGKSAMFGGGLIPDSEEDKGYFLNSEPTGKNIQLNGTGEKPFELVPMIKDQKKEK